MIAWVQRRHRGFAWFGLVAVMTTVLVFQSCQIRENTKTREALCALRHDVERRIEASDKLLAENPKGDIFGIPRTLIVSGRNNQQETVEALSKLNCASR